MLKIIGSRCEHLKSWDLDLRRRDRIQYVEIALMCYGEDIQCGFCKKLYHISCEGIPYECLPALVSRNVSWISLHLQVRFSS